MALGIALTAAAICGWVNFNLNDKYSDDAINRDHAAKWGVWGATAVFAVVVIVAPKMIL